MIDALEASVCVCVCVREALCILFTKFLNRPIVLPDSRMEQ